MELDDEDLTAAQRGFLLSLHDIGKFARAFQTKAPHAWPGDVLGPQGAVPADPGHEVTGLHLLLNRPIATVLDGVFPGWLHAARLVVMRALCGHHGRPRSEPHPPPLPSQLGEAERAAALAFVQDMLALFRPEPMERRRGDALQRLGWRLAGLATLADWIGSSARFPYAPVSALADLAAYLAAARARARGAIAAFGLAPARAAPATGMAGLFDGFAPTPLQAWAEAAPLGDGPVLAVIEDMTGAGKTEAALVLAHRLMAAGRVDGLFLALPTMATAGAMHARLKACWLRLFLPGERPNLVLAHGRAALDPRFVPAPRDADLPPAEEAGEEPAGAQCAAWLADDRRRALLAQVGVGTVDQALLAVLPVRHATLRQRGLARKVLVVDEAHAFDPWMREEMLALLRFHAAMGSSAIILSATLTQGVRQAMVDAFRSGLGAPPAPLTNNAYPLTTLAGAAGATETPCGARPGLARVTPVRRLPSSAAAQVAIAAAAARGAAVAWVRNSVDEAIAAHAALLAAGVPALLFHARFAMVDRLAIEAEVLRRFGKDSQPADRAMVVVATQVIEQSLDLDFDLLVSDLAPADLLIQRAGRLWRHRDRAARPLPTPEMLLLSPEPREDAGADWLREHRGTAAVYRDPALLWRSARAVLAGGIAAPEGLRGLIEAAAAGPAPAALQPAEARAIGAGEGAAGIARQNALRFEAGYAPDAGLWDPDILTPTRMENDPQVTLRLARWDGTALRPWAEDANPRRAWALSEVSVAARRVPEALLPAALAAACAATRQSWSRWEQESPRLRLAPVTADGALPGNPGLTYGTSRGLQLPERR